MGVGPSSGIKMLFFALLLTFFFEATNSEVYEDAMNRQIEDDVLRKFYIDMSPGHTIYESQSGFNIEDYFDDDTEAESQESPNNGVDFSRISTEQIKKVLQAASSQSDQHSFDSRPSQPKLPATPQQNNVDADEGQVDATVQVGDQTRDPAFVF